MAKADFQFQIEGEGAEKAAQELARLFNEEFGTSLQPHKAPPQEREGVTRGDPVVIAALILSIPPAILAVMDLVDRIQKKKKLDTLLQESRQVEKKYSGVIIRIIKPDGTIVELVAVESREILDAAEKSQKK
ncbi:MAG: hypothetical protein L0Y74_00080 [candidate division Zixibacteria bacterium]|nr:hypothetical protein [candidate division Zixibacteria bacterium]